MIRIPFFPPLVQNINTDTYTSSTNGSNTEYNQLRPQRKSASPTVFHISVMQIGSIVAWLGPAQLFLMWHSCGITLCLIHIIKLHWRVLQHPHTMNNPVPDTFTTVCRAGTPLTRPPFENLLLFGLNAELSTTSTKSSFEFMIDHLRLSAITTAHPMVPNFHSVRTSCTFITGSGCFFIAAQNMCGERMANRVARRRAKTVAVL